MVGDPLDVLSEAIRVERLECVDDPAVQHAPSLLNEARVGHLVGQRVLEHVFDAREQARLVEDLVQELARLKMGETAPQDIVGQLGHRLE